MFYILYLLPYTLFSCFYILQDGNTYIFPAKINDLFQMKFVFMIDISDYNLRNKVQGYPILKLTNNCKILFELKKKFKIDQVTI